MRTLAAPPCSRCGSKNTYADAIDVSIATDPPNMNRVIHCRDCITCWYCGIPFPRDAMVEQSNGTLLCLGCDELAKARASLPEQDHRVTLRCRACGVRIERQVIHRGTDACWADAAKRANLL